MVNCGVAGQLRSVWSVLVRGLRFVLTLLLVLVGSSLLVFSLAYLTGDPTTALLPADTPPEAVAAFRQQQGFDAPWWVQYGRFLQRAVQGDFGQSLRYRQAALPLVFDRLGASLRLFVAALGMALLVSVPAGLLTARYHETPFDRGVRSSILIGQALPPFVVAQLLILLFAVRLQWLPATGDTSWRGLILPVLATSSFSVATLTKLLRSSTLEALSQDYIRTARAKGVAGRWLLLKHTLRNAIVPMLAALSVEVNSLLAGTAIIETVFAYPGMGRLIVEAASARDVPLIQAFVSVVTLFVVLVNLLFDVLYRLLDPRLAGTALDG